MEFFLFMTLSASLLILAALVLRPLTGRALPRTMQMGLWIAASLRLLLPVEIRLPFSFFSLFAKGIGLQKTAAPEPAPLPPSTAPAGSGSTMPSAAATPLPIELAEAADPVTFSELLPWIWLSGIILTVCILLFLHIREMYRCRFKVRDTEAEQLVPRSVRVYRCAAISAPFVTGVFCPQIILPATLPTEDLPAVLAHELAHIRGLDVLKKHLFAAALCVNWFNPLVWVMAWLAARDIEILCDHRALRRPDAPHPKAYAHALLNAEERRTLFTLSFKSNTEVRIMKILKKEKTNRLAALLSVLLVILVTAACAVQPAADTETATQPASEPETATIDRMNQTRAELEKLEILEIEAEAAQSVSETATQSAPEPETDAISRTNQLRAELERLEMEIDALRMQQDQISERLLAQEQLDAKEKAYKQAAVSILGEDASSYEIRKQIAWLKAEDALGSIAQSLPDTTGKECVQINVKRADNDEVLSSYIVPKDDYLQYLSEIKSETAGADVYVSFTLVQ